MKNVRANEALQERWTEDAKKERNCKLQNPSLLVLPWKHKAEWVQIEVRKLWWPKVKEWLASQESSELLNMGKILKTLETYKKGRFWDGEQPDSNWIISYCSWFFSFCSHSVVISSCCDHNRSYWKKMWPIHQIISIYQSQTDYMAQNRDSYSQVAFRNLMKKEKVVFLVRRKVLHWRNNKINFINCNISTIISFSFNIVFKLSVWNYHTQLNTKKVKINSEKK